MSSDMQIEDRSIEVMKRIIITGSSRGIGYHMAKCFLEKGHQVLVSGSTEQSTDKAFKKKGEVYIVDE